MKSLVWVKEKTALGENSPSSREGHTLTYIPELHSMLLFGGNYNHSKLNEVYLYDIDNNTWRLQPTTGKQPSPRAYHSAFYEGSSFFVYGGQGENGKSLSDFNFLNVTTWEWKLLFIIEAPPPRHHTVICDLGNPEKEKVIFGGVTSPQEKLLNDLWIVSYPTASFNTNHAKITGTVCTSKRTKGDIPAPRKGHCAVVYSKYLFVYGGYTENPEEANSIHQLIFETWTWKKVAGISKPLSARYFMTTCVYEKNILLMFGGIDSHSGKHLNDVITIDLEEFKWSSPFVSGHLPMPRFNHAACTYQTQNGEAVMIIGGQEASYCSMNVFKLMEKGGKVEGEVKKGKEVNLLFDSKVKENLLFDNKEKETNLLFNKGKEVNLLFDNKGKEGKLLFEKPKEVNLLFDKGKEVNLLFDNKGKEPSLLFDKTKEKKDQLAFETKIHENDKIIRDLEQTISKEKDITTDLEKQIFLLEEELDNLQNAQSVNYENKKEEVGSLDEQYFVNYDSTKILFSMIPIEQLIFTEININNSMLEDIIQKSESYLIALDKLYLAISKYKFDENDDHEMHLRDIYETTQDDVLHLREEHKNSLYLMKTIYDDHTSFTKKADNDIHRQRQRILEIDKNFKEILVQSETEEDS